MSIANAFAVLAVLIPPFPHLADKSKNSVYGGSILMNGMITHERVAPTTNGAFWPIRIDAPLFAGCLEGLGHLGDAVQQREQFASSL